MAHSRREALLAGLVTTGGLALPADARPTVASTRAQSWAAGIEGQRRADLGNGMYRNPILSGDRPDPNILKDGADYYATFSSFLYYPAVVLWHSRDLINWTPIGPALTQPIGSIWALDIAKHGGRYFIYIPAFGRHDVKTGLPVKIFAIHADNMRGPWSAPVDMGIEGYIDPGHVVGEDGKRYLFLNDGNRVRISDDGLRRDGPVEQVYGGWAIPEEWVIEAPAHEGPKLLRHDGYFYLFSGQGGTAGPPTSHMVVVARSRSIHGPWENCPHNPIVHTAGIDEPWWSRGHGTPVQGPAGDWWLAYHGYENGFRTLGRQMLLEPFDWSAEGWPRMRGGTLSCPLPKPKGAPTGPHGVALSGPFAEDMFGPRLSFYDPAPNYLARARVRDGVLTLQGRGTGPADSSPLAFICGDQGYDITVEIELDGDAQGGLLLFYDDKLFCGIGAERDRLHSYKHGDTQAYPSPGAAAGTRMTMRVANIDNVASFFIRPDGGHWRKVVSFEVAGYNHNMADGFMSLRPALFASGTSAVRFGALTYREKTNTQES